MSKTKVTSKIIDNIGTLIILLIIFVTVFYFIASFITKYTGFFVINPDKNFETCLQLLLAQNQGFQKKAVADEAVAFLKELLDKQIVLALV